MVVELFDLRVALEEDGVVPFFQPIVQLRTGKLTGFEVLMRWQHPVHGPILPSNFISLAEENGLIGALSHQIFQKAFASAALLPEPLTLSVNLSAIQLQYFSLAGQIRELAKDAEFPLTRLIIEITEGALLRDIGRSQKIAEELKEMGCRLSLDDFGTGFSSLPHLKALPFDELKIDRSFVSTMTSARDSRKIVASIIGLSHSLSMTTVAEGVETDEQADMLLCLGCELGQGWLYGRPVPASELAELVTAPARVEAHVCSAPGDGWAVSSLEALPTQRLAQLQAIYEGAPVALCFLDREFRFISLNKRLAELNSASVESHLGKLVKEKYPETFLICEPYLLRALEGEAVEGIEIAGAVMNAGGAEATLLASCQPAFDEADEVIGISVAIVDISEKVRIEEALRESDDQVRHLIGINHQKPWAMDAEGNSLQVSSQWIRNSDMRRKPSRNLGWLEALHEDDVVGAMKAMKHSLRSGTPIDIEYRIRIDEDWKWMRSQGSPRMGSSGEIIRWYGTVEDIDARKQLEATLQ
jgi:PAS domain S-box-containing protein